MLPFPPKSIKTGYCMPELWYLTGALWYTHDTVKGTYVQRFSDTSRICCHSLFCSHWNIHAL